MLTKTCSICKNELPKTNEYFSHHVKSSGTIVFDAVCKPCAAAKKRQKRKDNPEHERELDRKRHERDYEKRIARMREYRNEHREELNAKNKIWWHEKSAPYKAKQRQKHAENPEIRRQYQRDWFRKHPDQSRISDRNKRAKRRNVEGSHTLRDEINQREIQSDCCYWCSKKLNNEFQVDHVIPLSRGGTNWANNIVISCPFCNNSKNARLPYIEWQPPNPLFPPK